MFAQRALAETAADRPKIKKSEPVQGCFSKTDISKQPRLCLAIRWMGKVSQS
jgi:hypothetical protein